MGWQVEIRRVECVGSDRTAAERLLDDYFGHEPTVELSKFINEAAVVAAGLPRRLRSAFSEFRTLQRDHALCVETRVIDDQVIGPTPTAHRAPGEVETITRYDALHLMFASLLGVPFGWTTIQSGFIFNDVVPIPEHRELPASSGFANAFGLHTEDAFHVRAGDYLGLLCLRNPGGTSTILSGIEPSEVGEELLRVLFEPRFIVGANVAHDVEPITKYSSICFGNPATPYLRVNLNASRAESGDVQAAAALAALATALNRNASHVPFRPGEFWYLDNLRVAHGRVAYEPEFDGNARWLRRLYISSAYRYTAALRDMPESHLLNPELPLYDVVTR